MKHSAAIPDSMSLETVPIPIGISDLARNALDTCTYGVVSGSCLDEARPWCMIPLATHMQAQISLVIAQRV